MAQSNNGTGRKTRSDFTSLEGLEQRTLMSGDGIVLNVRPVVSDAPVGAIEVANTLDQSSAFDQGRSRISFSINSQTSVIGSDEFAASDDDGKLEGIEGCDIGSGGGGGGYVDHGSDEDDVNPPDPDDSTPSGGDSGGDDDCSLPVPYDVPSPCD